ncbi:unnamed protein product [Rotaria magnacalcarata]
MSSPTTLLYILFYHCVTFIIRIDAHPIRQETVEQMVGGLISLEALQWSQKSQIELPVCELCHMAVPLARLLIEIGEMDELETLLTDFCVDFKLFDKDICLGAIHEYKHVVVEVLTKAHLTDQQLCAITFGCEKQSDFPVFSWNVTFPDKPKPPPQPPQPPAPESPKLNVLHLSDIHVDFGYKPGSIVDCSAPLCCRGGQPASGNRSAGFWGDYGHCDLPQWTAKAILKHIADIEKIDFVYYTGDLPPHDVWNQSREDQIYSINTINQWLVDLFPNKIFYSTVGNHEAAPCNLYPTPSIRSDNISWLYEVLADSWIKLGLPNDTRDSILRGAFYTTITRSGFRLISLNMNYCPKENYWLYINSTDPLGQLQWLIQWLQYAEDQGEKVHLIGHHPPQDCLAAFSWNFHKIINRYENTIAGQFYGHRHNDEFAVVYDEVDTKRPVSMMYIGPSLTTESFLNPGYRIFSMDGDYPGSSYWVLDHRTVIMNLTAANMYNTTIFVDEYNARDSYQMKNLFPEDWGDLIERMQTDIDGPLMSLAYTHYTKSYQNGTHCDHNCRQGLLCGFKTSRSEDFHACDSIPSGR